ncbi:MAG: hypothetical protein JO312_15645 [Hyphomicrobiales bacterium]|nr:hypothetical protein [Hyphomicrobiales bacterium]
MLQFAKLLLLNFVIVFTLTACSSLPTPVVPEHDSMSFQGMNALVGEEAPGRPLHVLLVHGMGTPTPNGFDAFIVSLASRFGLVQIPPHDPQAQWQGCYTKTTPAQPALIQPTPEPIENTSVFRDNRALLYTYNFAPGPNAEPALTVSYLLWAPLTAPVKCNLETEDDSAPAKQAFAAFAKDFIDDKLADALLYAGTYRKEVIRPSVQGALCKVTGGTWHADTRTCAPGDYQDPTVIITHSLGGYMLMDSIQAELRVDDCRPNSGGVGAEKILENTPVIYMMANQLALLDLSTLRRDPQEPKIKSSASEAVTKQFAKCWLIARARARQARPSGAPAANEVVAFSDPNDILSWRLEPRNLNLPRSDWGEVAVTNVFMSNNEFSVPLLFSDPTNAHTGYFVNPTVMDMLICGMNNGAVGTCPPNRMP